MDTDHLTHGVNWEESYVLDVLPQSDCQCETPNSTGYFEIVCNFPYRTGFKCSAVYAKVDIER